MGRRISGIAWDPAVTARRIIAWLQHSSVVLQGAEFAFYRAFLKSLANADPLPALDGAGNAGRQGETARPYRARLCRAVAAGAALGVAHSHPQPRQRDRAADPAGRRPISRNPMAVMELLADLLPLRQTYTNQAEEPPAR